MAVALVALVYLLSSVVFGELTSNEDLVARLEALEKERLKLEEKIQSYRLKTQHLLELYGDVLNDKDVPSTESKVFKRQQDCNTAISQIAFHTRLSAKKVFNSSNERITFDVVHTNIGNGYNISTGIFTAPRTGNYQLMATAMSENGNYSDITMKRDLTYPYDICKSHAGSSHQSMGFCVAFVALRENESVYVQHYSNRGKLLAGGKFSSFSGHLIPQ